MSFLHPALVWGLLLVGAPVLIHLINMLRHRRVPWAAMEFLLASQKRNRARILLKQLLLLLLRAAAIATLVLVVAQPVMSTRWGALAGGRRTHHIVLLDDSFSMSDRWAGTIAFDEAKSVIRQIGATAVQRLEPQRFTLLRFSQAARLDRDHRPDMLAEVVDNEFTDRLGNILRQIATSETAAGPLEAVRQVGPLLGETDDESRVIYLVSDFRQRQWNNPEDLRAELARLADHGAAIHLIDCVDRARPNLAIARLEAAAGTRAARFSEEKTW